MYGFFQIGTNTRRDCTLPPPSRNLPYTRSMGFKTASVRGASTTLASSRRSHKAPSTLSGAPTKTGTPDPWIISTFSLLFSSRTATTRSGSSSRRRGTSTFLVPPTRRTLPDRGGRPRQVPGAADSPLSRPESEEGLGQARHQADDALRGHGVTASDLPEDLLGGGDGIQLPPVDLLHELVVLAAQALLHLLLEALLGPRDDELLERRPPSLLELAALLEVGAVLLGGRCN